MIHQINHSLGVSFERYWNIPNTDSRAERVLDNLNVVAFHYERPIVTLIHYIYFEVMRDYMTGGPSDYLDRIVE